MLEPRVWLQDLELPAKDKTQQKQKGPNNNIENKEKQLLGYCNGSKAFLFKIPLEQINLNPSNSTFSSEKDLRDNKPSTRENG